jgi:hypothetical protein
MSIVLFEEMWQDRGAESAGVDDSTATRQWRVVTNDKTHDAIYVITYGLSAGILPQLYAPLPTNAYLTARRLRADSQSETPLHWIVTASYSSAPVSSEEKDKEENPDPLNRKAKFRWSTNLYREAVEKDIDDNAILNSAGDYFDPPIERDRSNWVLTVTRNMTSVPAWLLDYNNCPINESSFTVDGITVEEKKARLTTIDIGEEQIENNVKYRVLTMQIEFKKEGWTAKILDQGLRKRTDLAGGWKQVHIEVENDNGELSKVTSPVMLDGEGGVLDEPSPDTAVFLDYELYEAKDFSVLPLT